VAESIGASMRPVPPELAAVFPMDSPAWTRLEPQSVSGDPRPGLEARVHDPAWLLARQWQLGEFQGEDAGSPVSVQVRWASTRVDGWRPHGAPADDLRPLGPGDLLEPLVESEPVAEPGLRRRFEAGAQFLSMLEDAGVPAAVRDAVRAACVLVTAADPPAGDGVPPYDPGADPHDPTGPRLAALLGHRLPDAERIAAALERAAATGTVPGFLPAGAMATAREWLDWYRERPGPDCWTDERLEYAFEVAAGPLVLTAPAFGGGRADWYHFEKASGPAAADGMTRSMGPVLARPLRFPGMAADRYWEFEDGEVNFGALQAEPHDLARLALAEFALVYGQDWLAVPIDVPVGALTVIKELTYTDTFGHVTQVPRADDQERFQLFEIEGVPGLLVPPAAPGVLEGAAVEEVRLLRDEAANLVWAVEHLVRAPGGDPRVRADEPQPLPPVPGAEPGADMDYLLQGAVPDWWIPLVTVSSGPGAVELRKGAMVKDLREVRPVGVLLRPDGPLTVGDEEVPREGVRIRRVPVLARRPDGGYARWIGRRVSVGRGEGASRLAFDAAIPRQRPEHP
jgi:hypothetical protein